MKTMYPAQVNSPGTELAGAIDAAQDTIQVADGAVLPDGPNLLTIGTDEAAETILYTGKTGDELTGVTRGFQGTAQSWAAGTKVARYFTAYDHDAAVSNISELSTGLKELGDAARDRLDIIERQDVVLNAGMQILNAQRRAAFSLGGIKGQTLVNALGRMGSCEDTSKIQLLGLSTTTITLSADKTQGSNSFKVTQTQAGATGNGAAGFKFPSLTHLKTGSQYLLVADFKSETLNNLNIHAELWGSVGNKFDATIGKTWSTQFYLLGAVEAYKDLFIWGNDAGTFFIDAIRLYEVTPAEYAALANMTPEQVAEKYPYVDSVQPVRNPYAIRYGENLLPPFYEWTWGSSYVVNVTEPYAATLIRTAAGQNIYKDLPIVAGKYYTISWEHDSAVQATVSIQFYDKAGNAITGAGVNGSTALTVTALAPQEAVTVRIVFSGDIGSIPFKNPMLVVGSQPKPFKPREDSMLALQADLYADPLTGANADEVFEKDGQYFKLAKWKKIVLDGSTNNTLYSSSGIAGLDFKVMRLDIQNAMSKNDNDDEGRLYIQKYDGKLLSILDTGVNAYWRTGDLTRIWDNFLYLSIPNTDSGWGNNYTPTADENKAYFMGWKMFEAGVGTPYNGTGTKYWGKIYCGVGPNDGNGMVAGSGVSTLPTTMNDMGYTPYQLVYQLAMPTVEPIVSEGMLTFNEGDNQIEVGSGLVVREGAVFAAETPTSGYSYNAVVPGAGQAKYKVKDFLNVYESGRPISGYTKVLRTTYNGAAINLPRYMFNASAAYSVSYWMLDTTPIVPFIGSYAANEKAMLQELTDSVQQNATAVSVLMNKKADKDAPGWITPTLLNGWAAFSSLYYEPQYYKDSFGYVHIRGLMKSGAGGVAAFILPMGYRPKKWVYLGALFKVGSTISTASIDVRDSGIVYIPSAAANADWLQLDGVVPFLAEQ